MILDNFLVLSGAVSAAGVVSGQAVTATAVSTNTVDAAPLALGGNTPFDSGVGENMYIDISTLVAATAAGAATVRFELIQADDAALTTNVEVLAASGDIGKASLTVGAKVQLRFPPNGAYSPRRYWGLRYTVSTGPLTAGSFFAALVKDVQGEQVYGKSGFLVS